MTEPNQNFELYQGDTKVLRCTVTDSVTGLAKNLTGASIIWGMFIDASGSVVLEKTTDDDIEIIEPTDGIFEVTITSADSAGLPAGWYAHEAEVTDAAGSKSTVLTGTIQVIRSRIGAVAI